MTENKLLRKGEQRAVLQRKENILIDKNNHFSVKCGEQSRVKFSELSRVFVFTVRKK